MSGLPHRKIDLVALANQSDPLCEAVRQWLAEKAEQSRLERQWQDQEHRLMEKCTASGVSFASACKGRSGEAQEMRLLMRQIKAIDHRLDIASQGILSMRASSAAGALALIELGLAIQEPLDCEEHAWALLRSGADQMRALLRI